MSRRICYPLGATVYPDGVKFCVYSKNANDVDLLLFDHPEATRPSRVIRFDPKRHRTFHYWHIFVPGLRAGQIYAYRAHGPHTPGEGMRFDPSKVLLDPYGFAVAVPSRYSREAGSRPGDTIATAMKSVVTDPAAYDWEGDEPLGRPFSETVIYEMHVAGFTKHPNSGVAPEKRGTYAGVIEKIPYLVDLGVTAVELLPVYMFDFQDAHGGLPNYWGYSPVSFFAPHVPYSASKSPLGAPDEFRDMVKALHRAGIEVILDVVYNHTAEGGEGGPTFSWRGFENEAYYILDPGEKARYLDFTGCGNTVNANHTITRRMILDSLHHWVRHMHVDGFRFDLASVLARGEDGVPRATPPVLWDIESDPVLADTKLIAEAWDAAGLYQVGNFIGDRWKEWNGRFRDDIRRFVKGDREMVGALTNRLLGSPDMYAHKEREPDQSINFVTCHDGFTLNDLVSYDRKHNEANNEGNRDGTDANYSWNHGAEGPTDDPDIEALRNRQVKNFHAANILSVGAPMILMGDEVRRTQQGNNNAYCQDSEISWFDWSLLERHADVLEFVKGLLRLRATFDVVRLGDDLTLAVFLDTAKVEWHGVRLHQPDWSPDSRSLAACIESMSGTRRMLIIMNAHWEPLEFELPPATPEDPWFRIVDTSLPPPDDFRDPRSAPRVETPAYATGARSVVMLVSKVPREPEEAPGAPSAPEKGKKP